MPCEIIIADANSKRAPLPALEKEISTIYTLLNRVDRRKTEINPVRVYDVTIEKLHEEITNRQNINFFHFSGHAGEMELLFANEIAAHAPGIAGMIGAGNTVRFVFLNGCATQNMVEIFHSLGVKVVIATTREVMDEVAAKFAVAFYENFSQGVNIKVSFDRARNLVVSNPSINKFGNLTGRHIAISDFSQNTHDACRWGIYYPEGSTKEQMDTWESWSIKSFIDRIVDTDLPDDYYPAVELLKTIGSKAIETLKIMQEQKSDVQNDQINAFVKLDEAYRAFNGAPADLNDRRATNLVNCILTMLPKPISDVFRKLYSAAKVTGERPSKSNYRELIHLQIRFYDITLQFAYFIVLSNFFEILYKYDLRKKSGEDYAARELIFKKHHQKIKNILVALETDSKTIRKINYVKLIRDTSDIIYDTDEAFVSEYRSPVDEDVIKELDRAHEIIEIKRQFLDDQFIDLLPFHAKDIESQLNTIYKHIYYILRYKLLVIRNIEAFKVRHRDNKKFFHRLFVVAADGSLKSSSTETSFKDGFTDNYSVILIKGINRIVDYLSLSPFIIDKGAITDGDNANLHMFSHKEDGKMVFKSIEHPDKDIVLEISTEDIPIINDKNQLEFVKKPFIPAARAFRKEVPTLDAELVSSRLLVIYEQVEYFETLLREFCAEHTNDPNYV